MPTDYGTASNPGKNQLAYGYGVQGQAKIDNKNDRSNYINPPTDYRLDSILGKLKSPLRKGIIQQIDSAKPASQPFTFGCRFMFNPGQIDVGYSVAEGVTPPGELTIDQAKASGIYPGATTISFSLLFDRTYELGFRRQPGTKDLRAIGVYADIAALEAVVGVRSANSAVVKSADGTTPAAQPSVTGNMLYSPVYVIFGGGNGNNQSAKVAGLTYTAYITSMSVSYALFTESMVPTRAGVQITMQQLVGANPLDFQKYGGTLLDRANSGSNNTSVYRQKF